MMTVSCSIIVRAFNEEKHIGRLLTGLNQQTRQDFELIVVDSGSTDRTGVNHNQLKIFLLEDP
jgi:glycosyltransferase involved in cell wall biosynthesis